MVFPFGKFWKSESWGKSDEVGPHAHPSLAKVWSRDPRGHSEDVGDDGDDDVVVGNVVGGASRRVRGVGSDADKEITPEWLIKRPFARL